MKYIFFLFMGVDLALMAQSPAVQLNTTGTEIIQASPASFNQLPYLASYSITLLGKSGGNVTLAQLQKIDSVQVQPGSDFEILTFEVILNRKGNLMAYACQGKFFPPVLKAAIQELSPDKKLMIESIVIRHRKTGKLYRLANTKFTVIS